VVFLLADLDVALPIDGHECEFYQLPPKPPVDIGRQRFIWCDLFDESINVVIGHLDLEMKLHHSSPVLSGELAVVPEAVVDVVELRGSYSHLPAEEFRRSPWVMFRPVAHDPFDATRHRRNDQEPTPRFISDLLSRTLIENPGTLSESFQSFNTTLFSAVASSTGIAPVEIWQADEMV
jgi:DNA-binding transcriptional LysR family regulator